MESLGDVPLLIKASSCQKDDPIKFKKQPFGVVQMNGQKRDEKKMKKFENIKRQLLSSRCFKYILIYLPYLEVVKL